MSDWREMADGQRLPWVKPQEPPRVPRRQTSDASILAGVLIIAFFWACGFAMGIFAHLLFSE